MTDVTCNKCGRVFGRYPSEVSASGVVYCSKECAKSARIPRTCLNCGVAFEIPVYRKRPNEGRFCSHSCAASHTGRTRGRRATGDHLPSEPFERNGEMVCLVPLLPNGEAVISAADRDLVAPCAWSLLPNGYASARAFGSGNRRVYMHRLISHLPDGLETDHINGDRLDNRRSNLQVTTRLANARNMNRPQKNSSTGALGVTFRYGRYHAWMHRNGKNICLGKFRTVEEAATVATAARRTLLREALDA